MSTTRTKCQCGKGPNTSLYWGWLNILWLTVFLGYSIIKIAFWNSVGFGLSGFIKTTSEARISAGLIGLILKLRHRPKQFPTLLGKSSDHLIAPDMEFGAEIFSIGHGNLVGSPVLFTDHFTKVILFTFKLLCQCMQRLRVGAVFNQWTGLFLCWDPFAFHISVRL